MLGPGVCAVHWESVHDPDASQVATLSAVERERAARLRGPGDRARFVVATALLRRVAGELVGLAPADVPLDRRCDRCGRQHGRPRLTGLPLHASITHSEGLAGIAVTTAGPVGLDMEAVRDLDVATLDRHVLAPGEEAGDLDAFFRYWTRKEAVVKATGDGIGIGLERVRVTAPSAPPALLGYPVALATAVQMADLTPLPGHPASVAVLGEDPVAITEHWHGLRDRCASSASRPRS